MPAGGVERRTSCFPILKKPQTGRGLIGGETQSRLLANAFRSAQRPPCTRLSLAQLIALIEDRKVPMSFERYISQSNWRGETGHLTKAQYDAFVVPHWLAARGLPAALRRHRA